MPNAHCRFPLNSPPTLLYVGEATFEPAERAFMLPKLWAFHFYRYTCEAEIAGHPVNIHPGTFSLTPPGEWATYRFTKLSRHTGCHFRYDLVSNPLTTAPLVGRFPGDFEHAYRALAECAAWVQHQPQRASARLWDLLWTALGYHAPSPSDQHARTHPGLTRTIDWIENHLAEPITLPQLSKQAELSTSHLTRLFHDAFGTTVIAYVRKQRVARARHLLQNANQPIKTIAIEVGIPDPHQFNKTIRRELGMSPTQVRDAAR